MTDYNTWLEKGRSNRARCNICSCNIPEGVDRIEKNFQAYRSSESFRICAVCLIKLSKLVKKDKAFKDWQKALMVKRL
jgi:hypothetical protein